MPTNSASYDVTVTQTKQILYARSQNFSHCATDNLCICRKKYESENTESDSSSLCPAIDLQIQILEKALYDLHAGPLTLRNAALTALHWALSRSSISYSLPRQSSLSQEFERLKCILADILRICIGFLKHPYFQKLPSEPNRRRLMYAVLSKRRTLEKKRHLAGTLADRLDRADFLTSLSPQDRASLLSAVDGEGWRMLREVVAERLPSGLSELEYAVQRSCVGLLDVMYRTWNMADD